MFYDSFTRQHRATGKVAAWGVCLLEIGYAVTTVLGFLSLKSPQDPIGDPFFSIMELLILAIAPLMVVSMVAVHAYAPPEAKAYSFTALIFMICLAGLIGIPLGNMQVRNIGILGYCGVAPLMFLLLGIVFDRQSSHAKQS